VLTSASRARIESPDASLLSGVLKLDANESTIPPSPLVEERLRAFLTDGDASWYPDNEARALRRKLAEYTSRSESDVLAFNGCDAAIDCAVRAFASAGDRVCICAPTYDRFRRCAEMAGAVVVPVLSDDPFRPTVSPLIGAIDEATRLVYVSNPNNPTGRLYSSDDIAALLGHLAHGVLIVDETYYEFAGVTVAPLLDRFDNLLVMRSFSKAFGLAGLRCGYTLSSGRVAARLRRFWSGRDVNALAQVAAIAALDDLPYMTRYVEEVSGARAWLTDALRSLGYTVVSSPANFILLRVDNPAGCLEALRHEQIYIRDRSDLPQLEGFVRITVGTLPQCEQVLEAIRRVAPSRSGGGTPE
jgi:histidinol-phosphate aminotransferase